MEGSWAGGVGEGGQAGWDSGRCCWCWWCEGDRGRWGAGDDRAEGVEAQVGGGVDGWEEDGLFEVEVAG